MTSYPGAWQAVVDFLTTRGVDTVFGLPADDLTVLNALRDSEIRFVLNRDQRNAGFMATGYALQSGNPAVCLIGKGPASTNVLTGVLEAAASAAPLVVLAAGTAVARRGARAFQELDQVALLRPLTKWAYRVDHPDRLVPALERAFTTAAAGAPGPVYLEIADDLCDAVVTRTRPWRDVAPQYPGPDAAAAATAWSAVWASRRPILVVGGGMRHRNGSAVVEQLATGLGAAVFSTASGRGAVDEAHELCCGVCGLYSPTEAVELWRDTDLVIALGSRLEETATFGTGFAPAGVPVVQVNIDATELSTEFAGPAVVADAGRVVEDWCARLAVGRREPNPVWVDRAGAVSVRARQRVEADTAAARASSAPRIAALLASLAERLPAEHVLVQENGLQDMWSYFFPFWRCAGPANSIVPSEQTSLGFGAAAAGGVKLAAPDRTVVALVGDGAFGMLGADLAVLAEQRIGVLFVVLDNGGYGWLQSQWDKRSEGGDRFRFVASPGLRELPAAVHRAVVSTADAIDAELDRALKECAAGRVAVVEVPVALSDVPADLDELDGDFPAVEDR
ncbi:thiamine pyrophosphate-binding protein [Actinocatenispora sera]|uniref:thiamine pyrophosphate-binding protein n=1 Tax=Actinocatenispora sera TaxID=390989 RepID=UPI0033F180ED